MARSRHAHVTLGIATLAAAVAIATASNARPPDTSLVVGEVSAQPAGRPDVVPALRGMVTAEVGALDTTTLPPGGGATVLSVSLVRMEATDGADGSSQVTCDVSGALRSERRGGLFAVVEGRSSAATPAAARGRGTRDPEARAGLESRALRAAVSSAVSRVAEAMKRRR